MQALLDRLEGLPADVDGVASAALFEAVLTNDDITESNIETKISTIVTMMEAIAANDSSTAIAGAVRRNGAGNAARKALTAYASKTRQRYYEAMRKMIAFYRSGNRPGCSESRTVERRPK